MGAFRPLAFVCALVLLGAGAAPPPPAPRGFSAAAAQRERADEARFVDVPSAQGALDHAAIIGEAPHYAGTPADHRLAEYALAKFTEYGLRAQIEPFVTVVDTPVKLALELVPAGAPSPRPARPFHRRPPEAAGFDLREGAIDGDPATANAEAGLPFLAGSADGEVTGPLVYVNRGGDDDYATLRAAHVDLHGAVAVIRYGGAFRGILVQRAQNAGAAAAILYSDPADDGAGRGATYPSGPWRPSTSVQRGTLGDGIRIPALPVSAAIAQQLLAPLHGTPAPPGWRGGLDVPYALGKGPAHARLVVRLQRKPTTLWNVVARIDGRNTAQSVILGAHRDAWVYGVGDNGAGTITMLEMARGLGYLAASGWRPERTIVVALWDGEEIGKRGSRAYVGAHRGELGGLVAYVNADEMLTGTRFGAAAVPALAGTVVEATREVRDPARSAASVYDRWRAAAGPNGSIGIPGGGSDHEPFLYDLGVPVVEGIGFHGPFGPYHSIVDDVRYATTQSDPGFTLHRTAALLYGITAMRLADADTAPYAFTPYVATLRDALIRTQGVASLGGTPFDAATISAAIDGFARAARIADARPVDVLAGIEAARTLDRIAFGVDGYASVAYPELRAALARHDAAAANAATARIVAALGHAAGILAR